MKTNSILASIFVIKTRERFERVILLLKVDGHESKAEVVSVTDLLMQSLFSHEG